jgi:hypothetical protein
MYRVLWDAKSLAFQQVARTLEYGTLVSFSSLILSKRKLPQSSREPPLNGDHTTSKDGAIIRQFTCSSGARTHSFRELHISVRDGSRGLSHDQQVQRRISRSEILWWK